VTLKAFHKRRLQGILSVQGIAGYECVPAIIGHFYKYKIFFHNTNSQLKTGKTGTHLSANTSPVQCSLTVAKSSIIKTTINKLHMKIPATATDLLHSLDFRLVSGKIK